MLEVRVRWGAKKEGERVVEVDSEGRREGRVLVMRVVRGVWRGEVEGGRSQREEPGIFLLFCLLLGVGLKGVVLFGLGRGFAIELVMGVLVVKGEGVVGGGGGWGWWGVFAPLFERHQWVSSSSLCATIPNSSKKMGEGKTIHVRPAARFWLWAI